MMVNKLLLLGLLLILFSSFGTSQQKDRWFKGNTHTHTLNSDGDSTSDDVVKWYRERGYGFVFITDHEYITDVAPLNALFARSDQFLVISGQEVTDSFGGKPYHSNGLGITKAIMPAKLNGAVETLQKNIDNIVAAGGIAQINHPNFGWALTADHLIKLRGYSLLEIHNGHFLVNNQGSIDAPSAESLWDAVLSSGKAVYAIADDDSHSFKRIGDPTASTPGHGWIYVRAGELTRNAIMDGIKTGNFYASTGVELTDLELGPKQVSVSIKTLTNSRYRTQFIGKNGKMLAETGANPAVYQIIGNEGYVRARVVESNGKMAWTQAHFIPAK
jgi:hypothetical protein